MSITIARYLWLAGSRHFRTFYHQRVLTKRNRKTILLFPYYYNCRIKNKRLVDYFYAVFLTLPPGFIITMIPTGAIM